MPYTQRVISTMRDNHPIFPTFKRISCPLCIASHLFPDPSSSSRSGLHVHPDLPTCTSRFTYMYIPFHLHVHAVSPTCTSRQTCNASREPPAAHASLSVRAHGGLHASGFSSFCRKMAAHGGWREEGVRKRAVPSMYGLLYFM